MNGALAAAQRAKILEEIRAERFRQIEKEGWTYEHDDQHNCGELALVAALFASPIPLLARDPDYFGTAFHDPWPDSWACYWDKRPRDDDGFLTGETPRDQLIKATALLIAEIERIDRAEGTA